MAHFAKVVDGKVTEIIVAEMEFFETFVDTSPGEWIQTSYNTKGGIHYDLETNLPSKDQSKALRKNYAGFGYLYDKDLDAFIPPKMYESWTLNKETCLWEPPVDYPTDDKLYSWNEEQQKWDEGQ